MIIIEVYFLEGHMQKNNCKLHQDKPLDYYCEDCSRCICMDCLMVGGEMSCKNHNIKSIQEVVCNFCLHFLPFFLQLHAAQPV